MANIRIGFGYDIHRLVSGRPLILGGVTIPFAQGLDGHSDADVLLHAIMDAMLGALALGDIGGHFPNTDPQYKNADSLVLLKKVHHLIGSEKWEIANIDATVVCEAPKLAPFIMAIREKIAAALQISGSAVSIKATTNEQIGTIGRGEGIAAMAVALLKGA